MKPEMKKLIIANLPYLLFVYLFGKLGQTYRLAAGADLSEKLLHLADGFSLAFESAAPSFHLFDLAVGVAGAVALRLMVYCKSKNAKKYRRGVEYGSARWGGPKDMDSTTSRRTAGISLWQTAQGLLPSPPSRKAISRRRKCPPSRTTT